MGTRQHRIAVTLEPAVRFGDRLVGTLDQLLMGVSDFIQAKLELFRRHLDLRIALSYNDAPGRDSCYFLKKAEETHDQPPGILPAHRGYGRRGCVRQFSISSLCRPYPEAGVRPHQAGSHEGGSKP